MKKFVTTLVIAASLAAGVTSPQSANAGIILCPAYGVGLVLVIIGAVQGSLGLIILGEDGSANRDALSAKLADKYSFIEDKAVINTLSDAIRAKAAVATADANGQKMVSLSQAEVLSILEPTGLSVLKPLEVQQMIADLQ